MVRTKMAENKKNLFLILSVFLAFLQVSEATFGYNATLLSKNGHDQNGRFLPFAVN